MRDSTYKAEAIEAAPNHAMGHHWTPEGTTEVPFTPIFPYRMAGAGDINSNVEDMARWVRMQLGMAPSMDAASSRPRISPIRACQRWHSPARYSMTLAG